jgi:hypothetical protein
MSALNLHVGELQRVVAQLEDTVAEAGEYPHETRFRLADALEDLTSRLELCRSAILEPDPSEPDATGVR